MPSNPPLPSESPPRALGLDQTQDAGPAEAPRADVQVSQRLGRFLLLRKLGEGGMGTVFAAYDEQLDRRVAVKLLHPQQTEQTTQRQRVLREAQAMARVSHPNVVHIYEVGELGSQVFMAMEYVDGTTLADWQERRPGNWREVLAMYCQAGRGLLAAHQTGLVHRDFKPENVLVDKPGMARVADFGLARMQGEATPAASAKAERPSQPILLSPLTATGTLSGTPGYMSPEQFRCEPVDSRSDQFSFCVALYEALYQQRPFEGESIAEVAASVLAGQLRKAPASSSVPIEIERALARGLAVDPGSRFPTMAELLAALAVDGERDPAGARSARRRLSALLVGTAFILGGGAMANVLPNHFTMRMLTEIMGFAVVLIVSALIVYRKSLLANAFHRGLTLLTLSLMVMVFCVRGMAWRLEIEILKYYPIDLLLLAGICAAVSILFLPRLWPFAPLMVAGSFASALWPQLAPKIANAAYTISPLGFIYGWYLVSNKIPESTPRSQEGIVLQSTR